MWGEDVTSVWGEDVISVWGEDLAFGGDFRADFSWRVVFITVSDYFSDFVY